MKVETEVSAFVVRKDMVIPYKTLETAATEADEYDLMRICDEHYICKHKDTAYHIIVDGDRIGCSCPAMTFHCKGNDVCKHLAVFNKRRDAPQKQITGGIAMELIKVGWTGEPGNMTPPDTAEAENPEPPESPKKQDEPEMIVLKCRWCGVKFEGLLAAGLKGEVEAHEMVCDKRPEADSEPPLGAKMYSRTCPHCNTRFDGTDLDEVKDRHRDHIPICPKNPANKQRQKADSSKTEPTETQPEQEEETNMKSNIPKEQTKALDVQKHNDNDTAIAPMPREMPSDAEFQKAQVARILKNQGSIYKASGKDVPDSAAVSNYAISEGISTETLKVEQTKEYALAIVRAHKGSRYVDASVLIRKDAIVEKTLIDLAEKNPKWILGWAHGLPDFDLNQLVHVGDKRKVLGLHIAGLVSDAWMFAPRNCETKAGRRAQVKILGSDWRETDEVADEQSEVNAVTKR